MTEISAQVRNQQGPQPGPQQAFLSTPADIAIYGGAAGGGKTWALLLEPLRHADRPGFNAVIFRRNAVQVRNPGGLWDESSRHYPLYQAKWAQDRLEWRFPSGARVKFAHLEHEGSVLDWQGAQIALLGFDELTHFSEAQFFYMLSRNRSLCGVRPYVRATCNPDADSWLAGFLSWWIDQQSGLPRVERSGQLRWLARQDGKLHWADSPEELLAELGPDCLPKSVTFIAANLFDNNILMRGDPGYLANLQALNQVDRARLLHGNWKIRPAAGLLFRREWIQVVEAAPICPRQVRYWDLAATPATAGRDPDYTVGLKLGRASDGRFYALHGLSLRASPHQVRQAIVNTASQDGAQTLVGLPRDPGQAGKDQAQSLAGLLSGYQVRIRAESGDKTMRFGPFSALCEAGNVCFVAGAWNEEFFNQLEAFPDGKHDDHADACSGALALLAAPQGLKIAADLVSDKPKNARPQLSRPKISRPNISRRN